MDERSTFLLELLDKLGGPLMGAVQTGASLEGGGDSKDAETLAALLGQSVQMGLSLAQKMDLKDGEESDADPDAVRLSLTAMAGQFIAGNYVQQGRVPTEEETQRLAKSLSTVLTFADNFTPSAQHTARLKVTGNQKPLFDETQSQIFYLSAMAPVLSAVAEFPFGKSETALIQEVAEKLAARAKGLREALIGSASEEAEAAFSELMILHTLARVYADCHRAQTKKLLAQDEDSREEASLDPVWKGFDLRLSMFETLLNASVPGEAAAGTVAPQVSQEIPAEAAPAAAPQAETPPSAPAQEGAGGPMGFFAKGESPATPAPVPSPAEAAPVAPQPAAPETPPPAAAPAPVEAAPAQEGGGGPMSFFKPGTTPPSESGGGE